MASTFVESSPAALNRLFRDISLKFSPGESEDVVKSSKRIYGEQFNSVDNQDLQSCLNLLHKLGYVSNTKLTLVKEFVATKSNKEKDINDTIDNFKESLPPQADPEKELQGRSDDFKKITKKLEAGKPPIVNLRGSAGVGKTMLAKEICEKWRGKPYVFDLREAKDMRAIYLNIMNTLKLSVPVGYISLNIVVDKIHEHIGQESKGKRVLLLLDNVEQFTAGQGKEGKNLKTAFLMFLGKLSQLDDNGKVKGLSILLTSRTQLHDVKKVSDYELEPLKDSFSEKILLSMETSDLSTKQKEKLLSACKGKPLLLKGVEAILMQARKAPSDLVDELEKLVASKEKAADIPVPSKSAEDAKEKVFDLEKEGVDEDETSVIEEMFNTLPSDSLKAAAVSISLFCGPFTASTAAKILRISYPEAVAQLEGLVTSAIIFVVDREAKELMYDIHPLLRKYAGSIKDDAKFTESYTRAKEQFYDHFMSKMNRIAGYIESDYVKAFSLFLNDQPNYEFAIEITLQPEFFSVPGEFYENALIASLVHAMLPSIKQKELFHSWAEMCEDDTKSGSLFRAQLRCWEARQVLEDGGPRKAFEVLQQAASSLGKVEDQTTKSFKLTQGLFLYFEGEIHCQNRDYKKALECLQSSLDLTEELLEVDTNLARCYNAMGNCYYGLDKPQKALEFYKKAMDMRMKLSNGSEYHYDMPVYKNQLGTVHEDVGEYDMAVECYKDALRLLEELKITGYEDEALFLRNLANVYARQRKFSEAAESAEKAYNIRNKRLGDHPDTVRSIFQLGVIQANLGDFKKALDLFLKAWEMEKLLDSGNHSAVWKKIIKGVNDMCDFLDREERKKKEKEKIRRERKSFRRDALTFCKRFWKEEKESSQFGFTEYNKEIIDTIMELLGDEDESGDATESEYEEERLWFYEGFQIATEEDFYQEFDQETDNEVLNAMLRERKELLNMIIDFCSRLDQNEKRTEHERKKLVLYKKFLVRADFVGEEGNEKATLKIEVEQLYQDLDEKESIPGFRENLLSTWLTQWEESKGAEETKEIMRARKRTIDGILHLCQELEKKELGKRYGKEILRFNERLWELEYAEMEPSTMEGFLCEIKDLASLVGDLERLKIYDDALQTLNETGKKPGATLGPTEAPALLSKESTSTHESESEEEEVIDVESDEEIIVSAEQETEMELEVEFEVGSDEEFETASEEEIDVTSEEESGFYDDFSGVNDGRIIIFRETVTKQGIHWDIKQVAAHLTFPPDAVSEDSTVTLLRWHPQTRFPPLHGNEAIVSDVIELSVESPEGLCFNKEVTLVISHCAADVKGYEVVMKMLIDRDSNEWVDIFGTVDLRSLSDLSKDLTSLSDIPDYLLPVAVSKITQCSTFAVVCRLKSYEHTITSQGTELCFPDYPLVRVVFPPNAVEKEEELQVVVNVHEFPQKSFKGKEMLPGPILRITSPKTVDFLKPVSIQVPLSLREQQRLDIPDLSLVRVHVMFKDSSTDKQEWTEITEELEATPSFDGTVIKFSVRHFSDFWSWVAWCASAIAGLVGGSNTESVRKGACFAAFVPKDTRLDCQTQLRLYCTPTSKRENVYTCEKNLGNIMLGDGSSDDPMCLNDKAYVFLSDGIVRPVIEKRLQGFYVSLQEEPRWKILKVQVVARGELTVCFCKSQERDEDNMLCELDLTLPPPLNDPGKTPVEFFGLPFDDQALRDASLMGRYGILTACNGVLQDIGKGEVYNEHLDLASKFSETEVMKKFLMTLSKLSPQDRQKCFDSIVDKLGEGGLGLEHIKDRLVKAQEKINQPISDNVRYVVAEKLQQGSLWKALARDLNPKVPEPLIDAIQEEEQGRGKECCRVALLKWYQANTTQATNREVMRCLTNMGYAKVNWHIMKELGLVSMENMPESERL